MSDEQAPDAKDAPAEVKADEKPAAVTAEPGSRRGAYLRGIIAIVVIAAIGVGFAWLQRAQQRMNAAQSRMAEGQGALVDGDMDLALYQFTVALELDPRLAGAHRALGFIALARGRSIEGGAEAGRHFEAELVNNPHDRQSHLALGCLYALGIVPDEDPWGFHPYLLEKFSDVLPVEWSQELGFAPSDDIHPLAKAIYHFQHAAERLPADPAPMIGLSLAHVANCDIATARQTLSRSSVGIQDETALGVVRDILGDINQLEIHLAYAPRDPMDPGTAYMPFDSDSVSRPTDYSEELEPLPPMSVQQPESPLTASGNEQFWSMGSDGPLQTDWGLSADLTTRVTEEDLVPQPSVKPISHDIHLGDSSEWVRTVRIANLYQPGSVTFGEGDVLVMPYTETEVRVVEAGEDRIVLEEHGETFTWVRAAVGWNLERETPEAPPEDAEPAEVSVPLPDQFEQSPGSETDEELGPEVPAG